MLVLLKYVYVEGVFLKEWREQMGVKGGQESPTTGDTSKAF
jgi:hypothetical protein